MRALKNQYNISAGNVKDLTSVMKYDKKRIQHLLEGLMAAKQGFRIRRALLARSLRREDNSPADAIEILIFLAQGRLPTAPACVEVHFKEGMGTEVCAEIGRGEYPNSDGEMCPLILFAFPSFHSPSLCSTLILPRKDEDEEGGPAASVDRLTLRFGAVEVRLFKDPSTAFSEQIEGDESLFAASLAN